jgi:cytochrome c-type biogenesis protein CcmF
LNQDPLAGFPIAEPWSLAVGQAGKAFVFSGLGFFLLCLIFSVAGHFRPVLRRLTGWTFSLGSIALFGAFISLGTLFAKNQFQYEYVFAHGDVHTALQYKIAGIWSGQQGSFLLWATTSAIFGLLTMRGTGKYRSAYLAVYSGFLATLCGILAYETPFGVIKDAIRDGNVFVPSSGRGLEPSLLNYWVVIHPPTIFMGFGSLTVLFAYAISAILKGDLTDWIARVRPWVMVTTAILGVGICMGGFWAYETLGWGGFWGWDPVENASFIPWLFVVAFLHGIIVQTTKKRWSGTNLWLGALPFITFTYGTMLTRGGYLDNVSNHSFASMDKSALKILAFLLLGVVVGFPALFFARGIKLARANNVAAPPEAGIDRESMYGAGALFLSLLSAVLIAGMSWPVIMALSNRTASKIEEGPYHLVVVWFFVPIMILIAVAPFVSWRVMGFRALVTRISNVFSISVALTGVMILLLRIPEWGVTAVTDNKVTMPFHTRMAAVPWIAILLLTCIFALVANVWRICEMVRRSPMGIGGFVAHVGIATLFTGLIVSRGLEQKKELMIPLNQQVTELGYTIKFAGFTDDTLKDPDGKAKFVVQTPSGEIFVATPGLYYRPAMGGEPGKPMAWPYIRHYAAHDFYLTLGAPDYKVFETPLVLKPGETKSDLGVTVTYRKMTVEGQPGTASAKFGADLHISVDGGEYDVVPHIAVSGGADMVPVGSDYSAALENMDASDKSVAVQLLLNVPLFPAELFTKPLTIFVWAGAGIMALGSLIAAWSRRRIRTTSPQTPSTPE